MKKLILAIFSMAALLMACDTGGGGGSGFFPLPPGVYIAGYNYNSGINQACYWIGSKRVDLDGYSFGTNSITVTDGKVLVNGSFLIPFADAEDPYPALILLIDDSPYVMYFCYWIDGKRNNGSWDWEDKIIKSGKVYMLDRDGYSVDGQKIKIPEAAGYSLYPSAMTVSEDGKVYIAGTSYYTNHERGNCWYYTGGEVIELHGSEEYIIKKITLSGDKVYIFGFSRGTSSIDENYYFVDGVKITVNLPEGSHVNDYAIAGGTIYMVGYYGNGDKTQACWWIDGERHDLDGSEARAIWVEE